MEPAAGRGETGAWPLRVGVAYAVVVLIWGTTWYGIHTQVNGTSPQVGVALRMAAASLVFFAVAAATGQSFRLTAAQARLVAVEGVCFFGLNYLAVYAGSQYLTSGVVAVILSLTVPLTLFADWAIRGIRATPSTVFAAALGMGGVALVFGGELQTALGGATRWWGGAVVAASSALVAVGNVVAAQLMSSRMSWVLVNAFGMAVGCVTVLAWGGISGARWAFHPSPEWIAGYAYLVLLGSVVAFGIYMRILPIVGTTAGAYVTVLSPVLALVVSAMLEGFPIGASTYAGAALLLVGHSLLIRLRSRGGDF